MVGNNTKTELYVTTLAAAMKMPSLMIERLIYPGGYMVKEEVLDYVIDKRHITLPQCLFAQPPCVL